jgi:sugar lactone lactonase YvrE
MKFGKAFCLAYLFALNSFSRGGEPAWEWVRVFGGGQEDRGTGVAIASNGSAVFGGSTYGGTVGTQTLTSSSLFWARIDSTGAISSVNIATMYPLDWSATYTGTSFTTGAEGKVFITGRYVGRFNQGPRAFSVDFYGSFLGLLNADLSVAWLKQMATIPNEPPVGPPAIDSSGNVFSTSSFQSANYDGVQLGVSGGSIYTTDVLALFTTANGNLKWMKKGGGPANDTGLGSAIDQDGSLYSVGAFISRPVTFGMNIIYAPGEWSVGYISKRDQQGEIQWIKLLGQAIKSVSSYPGGGIVVGGIQNIPDFSVESWLDQVQGDGFLTRYNNDGSILWQKALPQMRIDSLVTAANGEIYAGGLLRGTVTLDGKTFTSRGGSDIFVGKFRANGELIWGTSAGGFYDDWIRQLAVGTNGLIYVCGTLMDGGVFGTVVADGRGKGDGFVAKLVEPAAGVAPAILTNPKAAITYFGAPVAFNVSVAQSASVSFQWYFNNSALSGQVSSNLNIARVTLENDGYYFVEVRNESGVVRSDSVRLIVKGEAPVGVTTVAGTTNTGFVDSSVALNVRFSSPNSLAILGDGTVAIPDSGNHVIRLMEPNGTVGTYAGKGSPPGLTNGPGSAAYFNLPIAVAVDRSWDLFVADSGNNVVRRVSVFGTRAVTTFSGSGRVGLRNGTAAEAEFNFPNDLVSDGAGGLFVTEFNNHTVRHVAADGSVTTFAGTGAAGYRDGAAGQALFHGPAGIARDGSGNLYVTDWENQAVRKITPGGVVSTIAGTAGVSGFVDGPVGSAKLYAPDGIAVDGRGNVFFTEFGNSSVRRIDANGDVLTLVGTAGEGFLDGDRATGRMLHPGGIAAHPDGSLLVADTGNHAIRKVVWQAAVNPTEAAVLIALNPSITVFGVVGKTYRIEVKESLLVNEWTVLGEVTLSSPVETWYDSQPVTRGQRYYRAVLKQ